MLAYIKYYCNYQVIRKSFISIGIVVFINLIMGFSNIKAENVLSTVTDTTIQTIKDFTDRSEDWERYVRNFRVAHNLSFLLGGYGEEWKVYGYKEGSSSEDKLSYMKGLEVNLRYNYDIQIYKGLGYSLGVSFVYKQPFGASNYIDYFNEYSLPSIFLGFVFNFNPMFRFYCGGDLYVIRLIDLNRKDYENYDVDMSFTEIRLVNILDIFIKLKIGIRLELDYSRNFDRKYRYNAGAEIPTTYNISNLIVKGGIIYTIM